MTRSLATPEGFRLVPIEPTEQMLAAVRQKPHVTRPDGWDDRQTAIYQKMVLAAPKIKNKTEWVGLTNEDIDEIHSEIKVKGMGSYKTEDIYRAIEAKLKERNT